MSIKLYWHRGPGRDDPNRQNFGDYLSPMIVEAVSGKRVEYAPLPKADMMAIGTILAKEPKAKYFGFKRRLHIWGSGCGQPEERFSGRHHYHAVRGTQTLQRIQGRADSVTLGDPGLLAEMLITRPASKKYRLGFIPHYVDQNLPLTKALLYAFPDIHFINVYMPPKDVLHAIASCEFLISSSLHGLVVADAFGIPNVRTKLSSGIIDELKFDDYYSAFGIAQPPILLGEEILSLPFHQEEITKNYVRPGLDLIKIGLMKKFPDLS